MKKKNLSFIIVLVLTLSGNSLGKNFENEDIPKVFPVQSQIVEHKDGELKGLERGIVYTLAPGCCEDSLLIHPIVSDNEYGEDLIFEVFLPAKSTIQVQLVLPESLYSKKYGGIYCSFKSNSLLWKEKNRRLNPRQKQTLYSGNESLITLRLGITVDIPNDLPLKKFSSFVQIKVKNISNNFITTDSARYIVDLKSYGWYGCPDGIIDSLVPGTIYTVDADPFRSLISPRVSGKENGTILEMNVQGDALARIGFRLTALPQYLQEQDAGKKIGCKFGKEAIFWLEGYKIYNPFEEGDAFLDEDGEFTLRIGMTITIPDSAKPSVYVGQILLNVWYKGLLQGKNSAPLDIMNCAVGTISVSVSNKEFQYALEQNYPNPFNPFTNFGFRIANFGLVTLKVYDVLGREVATLVNEYQQAGNYKITFNARHLERSREIPSGVYFYTLKAGDPSLRSGHGFIQSKKMVLLK